MAIDNDSTFNQSLGSADFGADGVSESRFGQGAGSAGQAGGTIRDKASGLREQATEKLRSFADEGKGQVAATLDGMVQAAREIADKLQDGSFGPIGGYATTAADTLQGWTDGIKNRSVEDLLDNGRQFVRSSPAVAVGVAVTAGFVLSRVLKAGSNGRYSA
jgi:ElaB/YqjD/DUF883 family membrane-anchored ribosome-binding protein